jgi:hypothetical protein
MSQTIILLVNLKFNFFTQLQNLTKCSEAKDELRTGAVAINWLVKHLTYTEMVTDEYRALV